MSSNPSAPPAPRQKPVPRQPLFWAALSYAAGIVAGVYLWRPAVWWLTAAFIFCVAALYFSRKRAKAAVIVTSALLVCLGAFSIQIRPPDISGSSGLARFADGREVLIVAHVFKEGNLQQRGRGDLRQRLDLETEEVLSEGTASPVHGRIRVNLYGKESQGGGDASSGAASPLLFRYGERLRFPGKLSLPHNFRNPGAFDYQGYLAQQGIEALASAKTANVEVLPGFAGTRWELWRSRIHRRLLEKVQELWPAADASLLDAMVVGEDAFLQRRDRAEFQRSGTYHVLVVSGMNLSILAFVTLFALRRFGVNDLVASGVTVLFCVLYAEITDVGPPIWRATLMLTLYLGGRAVFRERSMLNAIGAAALGLLVLDPKVLFGASFQLTFLCVLVIAGIGVPLLDRTVEPYRRGLRSVESVAYDVFLPPRVAQLRLDLRLVAGRLGRFMGNRVPLKFAAGGARLMASGLELLTISALMQLGLSALTAYYFHRVTIVGLPANILIVPLTGLLMPMAVAAVTLGFLVPGLAKTAAWAPAAVLHILSGSVHWFGALKVADVRIPAPGLLSMVVSCAALAAAMLFARSRWYLAAAGVGALVLSTVWIGMASPQPQFRRGALEVTSIDVGEGDSLLLVSPSGNTLLVDAGGIPHWMHSDLDIGEDVVSPYLWSRGIHHLDAVAVTHPHADHIGGMAAVLGNFHPRELWLAAGPANSELDNLLAKAKELNVAVVAREAGDNFSIGELAFRVLAPYADSANAPKKRNDDSLVVSVTYRGRTALLEGDAEKEVERRLAEGDIRADLLKVAHHGSASSSTPELLAAVHPRYAVISVGTHNVYGHPRWEVLERLAQAQVVTYRTDLDGAVSFYLDGAGVTATPAGR